MVNQEIRAKIRKSDLFQYEVADALGVSELTLIRWLRKPLNAEKTTLIFEAIKKAKEAKEEK